MAVFGSSASNREEDMNWYGDSSNGLGDYDWWNDEDWDEEDGAMEQMKEAGRGIG